MKLTTIASALALVAAGALVSGAAEARDRIQVVGSSTVFPFTTAVAERFGQKFGKAPIVESTGTGGGMKLFCAGVGANTPDASNASRRITQSEFDTCKKNGATPIEVKVGFDGIVLANSKKSREIDITLEQLYLALAAEIPGADGKLVKNPNEKWSDVAPNLPNQKIEVLGPPPTSGTRDAFNEMAMEGGCKSVQKRLGIKIDNKRCMQIRADGAYIEAGENDNIIVQKLDSNPNAFGIFGYSFLEENQDKIQGAKVNGIEDSVDNIASGKYPLSRSLYVYIKKEHLGVIPGLQDFINEYVSEAAFGEDGYLEKKGLVPLPKADREAVAKAARAATGMAGL
ncbi:PstS family phosphate ABC transporter substrate-binding protein [Blastochloris sulfoviridis]|uniref:PstS family phosphate ABC transporter substrate-binding protein n=1 Tax=Blastochloris sulfoviridis TaxID=50712 RepID=UPI001FE375E6|nr:PstS family phosphate ABC transporter substrate-binding protein [Blastochloris sulfoviridis]